MKKVIAAGLAASMLAVTAVGFAGCNNDETLRSKYEDYFLVGATMSYGNFEMYEDLAKEFSSMTCENEMKWDSLQPAEGGFDYSLADPMVEFAKEHDMGVRGHCLACSFMGVCRRVRRCTRAPSDACKDGLCTFRQYRVRMGRLERDAHR